MADLSRKTPFLVLASDADLIEAVGLCPLEIIEDLEELHFMIGSLKLVTNHLTNRTPKSESRGGEN
jgi:hypothetical protein